MFGWDDFVVKLGGTLAVKVETERGIVAFDETYRADLQVVAILIVDSQLMRGRAQRGENRVKKYRVSRKIQL